MAIHSFRSSLLSSLCRAVTPLVRFASVPPPDSSCDACKAATGKPWFSGIDLQLLSMSAESGCQECRLRHLGVLRALGQDNRTAAVTVSFRRTLTYIARYWASRDFVDGNLKVLLYTRFGYAKSSWPIVGVGREVG